MLALLLAGALGSSYASASEFKSYRKPDPQRFAQGVAAYDARNYAQAFNIWLPLAHHGDLAAIFNIGLMLRDGRGIPRDLPRALAFFKRGAEQNHLGCQVNLADMYYKGIGTKQDFVQAASWLMVAARRGHNPSMYKLAGMFERGEGVGVNLDAARALYLTAYEGGYQLAGNRLSELATRTNAIPPPDSAQGPPTSLPKPAVATLTPALRGTIGIDDTDIDNSPEGGWSLRASFATPQRTNAANPGPALRPRACLTGSKAFDAHPSMCRMPPVRN
jgi:hypothetical protein